MLALLSAFLLVHDMIGKWSVWMKMCVYTQECIQCSVLFICSFSMWYVYIIYILKCYFPSCFFVHLFLNTELSVLRRLLGSSSDEMVTGNAALCLAHCFELEGTASSLLGTDIVSLLLRHAAAEAERTALQRNAAIALGKLCRTEPRCLHTTLCIRVWGFLCIAIVGLFPVRSNDLLSFFFQFQTYEQTSRATRPWDPALLYEGHHMSS